MGFRNRQHRVYWVMRNRKVMPFHNNRVSHGTHEGNFLSACLALQLSLARYESGRDNLARGKRKKDCRMATARNLATARQDAAVISSQ